MCDEKIADNLQTITVVGTSSSNDLLSGKQRIVTEQTLEVTDPRFDILKQVLTSSDNGLNTLETEFVNTSIRKKEGILGNVKNLWDRVIGANRQPEGESQISGDTVPTEQVENSTSEPENTTGFNSVTQQQSESNAFTLGSCKIYALLVGIDNHSPASNVPSMNGCINDVIDVENYLNERTADGYQLHLRKLIDEDATRQAVIDGFSEHLCQAGSDDVALFYFGGHGSQEKAPEEFWHIRPNRLIDTLVCYDSRTEGARDLAEPELSNLILKVAEKNPHILIILDSSHSDFNIKGCLSLLKSSKEPIKPEFLSGQDGVQNVVNSSTDSAKWRHIILSACRSEQVGKEYKNDNGQTRGAFTYFLFRTLRQAKSRLTYRDLMRSVNALIRSKVKDQSPQMRAMYADDLDQTFLGGAISERLNYFTLTYSRSYNQWVIDAGAIFGILEPSKDTLLAIFPVGSSAEQLSELSQALGEAQVTEVQLQPSKVEITEGSDRLSQDESYWAIVTNISLPPLKIYIRGEDNEADGVELVKLALQTSAPNSKPSFYISQVEEPQEADYDLVVCGGQYSITQSNDKRPLIAPIPENLASAGYTSKNASQVVVCLEHIARWTNILKLSTPKTSSFKTDDVKMEILVSGQEKIESEAGNLLLEYKEGEDGELLPPTLQIRLSNISRQALYCNVLALSDKYAVSTPFFDPDSCLWLGPGETVKGEYINTIVPDELWEQGRTNSIDIFKLIVATEEFDVSWLNQGALHVY